MEEKEKTMSQIAVEKESEKGAEIIADENFLAWNDQLLTKKAEMVAQMYLEKGELFGTVSSKIRKGAEEITKYFDHFLEIDPSGKVIERVTKKFSENCYLDEGTYDFTVTRDGKEEIIHARFSYYWEKDESGDWKIRHHHSSAENEENKKLSGAQLDLSDTDNIEWGTNKEIEEGFWLQTGFYKREDGKIIRFTCISQENENNKHELIFSHLSECPEDHGV